MDNSTRFWASVLFHESTAYGYLVHILYPKLFFNSDSNSQRYPNSKVVSRVSYPTEPNKNFQLGDSLSINPFALGKCRFFMQTILKKYPFKGTGQPSKLFDLILQASYPSKQISAGYQTWNKFLRGIIPLGTNFCRVSDLSKNMCVIKPL